jgi:hypothetical protein
MFAEKARDLNADENIQGIYTDSLKKLIFDLSKEIKKKKKQ